MKTLKTAFAALACAGACFATAQAEPVAATMSCTGYSTAAPIQLKLLDYQLDLGTVAMNIGSQSSGAGAGKLTFQPFVVEAVIDQNLITLFTQMARGQAYSGCDIDFAGKKGLTAKLKLALVTDLKIVSEDERGGDHDRGPVARVTFEYGAITVADGSGAIGTASSGAP